MLTKLFRASLLLLVSLASYHVSADLTQALKHEVRSEESKARDVFRKPEQTLNFFEVTPQSTVVEVWPGAGWYTEILAPLLADKGKLYSAHFSDKFSLLSADYMQESKTAYKEKLVAHPIYKNVIVTEFAPLADMTIAPDGSADVVLSIRNQLYVFDGETSMSHALTSFYKALKPGGVLGVVAPRLPDDLIDTDWQKSGYVPEQLWLKLAEEAGFILEAESDMHINPKDTATHPRGIWTLPPTLSLGDEDKEKYLAIGEVTRMTLKFRKPIKIAGTD